MIKQCDICHTDIEVSEERAKRYSAFLCDKCKEKRRVEKIVKKIQSTIPKKFWDLETEKPLDKYKDKSLFIHGKAGVGKTVLACSLAKAYIRQNRNVKFISYIGFIRTLQGGFLRKEDVYGLADKVALYEGMLIIDDFGVSKTTEFVKDSVYGIINEREMGMLPMIITSNFDLNEIANMFDERISSRIKGMCEVLNIQGKDRR